MSSTPGMPLPPDLEALKGADNGADTDTGQNTNQQPLEDKSKIQSSSMCARDLTSLIFLSIF